MNVFVADPRWGWWIIGYFFLGGIAAGAYFMATLIDLVGRPGDRELARLGSLIAFPLIAQLCLAFGMAGLLWPEKVKGCTLLWFPWIPTYRAVRYSSIGAIVFSMLVVALFVSRLNPGGLP